MGETLMQISDLAQRPVVFSVFVKDLLSAFCNGVESSACERSPSPQCFVCHSNFLILGDNALCLISLR